MKTISENMQKVALFLVPVILLVLTITSCTSSSTQSTVENYVEQVKNTFIPDSRVDEFDISVEAASSSVTLTGETTNSEAKKALLDSLSHIDIEVVDNIEVLPTAELGEEVYALVNNSVSNLRSTPRHSAQLTTQALLGMPLQVLKKDGGWYYVRTPEDYLAWVDAGGIHRVNESGLDAWNDADKIIFTNTYGFSYRSASSSSQKVSDLAAGNILKLTGSNGNYYQISYPDGRTAYVAKDEAQPFDEWNQNLQATQQALVETAHDMMGIPYLWGGTSTKGVDCSGFTKTIYLMNGLVIPRDASQQVHAGELIDEEQNWGNLEPGDLLFFGSEATENSSRRVVHVGMWIGNDEFIHSSRQVRVSSVDSTAENYDAYNIGRYLESRRYIGMESGNIIRTDNMYADIKF